MDLDLRYVILKLARQIVIILCLLDKSEMLIKMIIRTMDTRFGIFLVFLIRAAAVEDGWNVNNIPVLRAYPCNDTKDISIEFKAGLPIKDENQYIFHLNKILRQYSQVIMQFDSEAIVTLDKNNSVKLTSNEDNYTYSLQVLETIKELSFKVKGLRRGEIPYFESIKINLEESCKRPYVGYLDELITDNQGDDNQNAHGFCGVRKVELTELIVNGATTKPGDWPWHVAIYNHDKAITKYICGGTLISKTFVLTAAHCATIQGVAVIPEYLSVVLGKYNYVGGDIHSQEREVHRVIIHQEYDKKKIDDDIALLKLRSQAVFNEFVQPACLWNNDVYNELPNREIYGTIVGWGLDHTDSLSAELRQATLQMLPDTTCIRESPVFYSKLLNGKKFCAGHEESTSPCNGDSGGGFTVFVPDKPNEYSANPLGTWYIRGIISVTISRNDKAVCDPTKSAIFTDVAKYMAWIQRYVKNDF